MAFVERIRPRFNESEAQEIAQSLYRIVGNVKELPSERDQNFLLRDSSGKQYVLKIASTLESESILEMQNKAMQRVAAFTDRVLAPRICRNVQNNDVASVLDSDGQPHLVRMLTHLPGIPLALFRPHSNELLQKLGKTLALIDQALTGFEHPAARRDLRWDFDRTEWVITHFGRHIATQERFDTVRYFLDLWKQNVVPALPSLRKSVVYHDANEYNVLVTQTDFDNVPEIAFIDFGDMLFTYSVADVAIAAAYSMLEKADPLTAAYFVIRGYHFAFPLTEDEINFLYYFISIRLCLSVAISAFQQFEEPRNDYLAISEKYAWDVLERLKQIHPRFAEYVFRDACGLSPHPKTEQVQCWLKDHFSEASSVIQECPTGGYAEMRAVGPYSDLPCSAEVFRVKGNDGDEWRSIHLGIDFFADPGTPVYSPHDGVVHSFKNNSEAGDYGPTIIIEYENFYLLYGHLSCDSLLGIYRGKKVPKGSCVGRVGSFSENGNWQPHLHLQMILDLLDQQGTFSGLCRPSQRSVWLSLCPDPNLLFGETGRDKPRSYKVEDLLARRKELTSSALSISYKTPLEIVQGRREYLFDQSGRAYLDCVNNVCHVGHAHPRVVAAAADQMRELNTNTRYLHHNLVEYAERLCVTLPEPLRVCFFVCSGSEANDLALRLARTYTDSKNTLVVEGAYHGNLSSLIEISPYKFDGPGGAGAPPHVRKVLMPDSYRGIYRGKDTGERYADDVRLKIESFTSGVPAFIVESALGCGGQIILPDGYLQRAFEFVRAAGGVCIVDEVQVGFGRVGSHFWCFETQNVVPDIVTMGKPIGNGHPMAAVVTTPKIAAAFENGMEYFNTFGGNPVSCAIGMAVLDVIRDEDLQQNALEVGEYLKSGLLDLMNDHPLVGDVRGLGLFIGIELVSDRNTLTPATRHASYIVGRMKQRGILLSTDGPYHNVLKIKPPMVFTKSDADFLIDNLEIVFNESILTS
jgi:4-aminobutyrate aminotransferase-like enzyme/Ser/Thr protein kinase RdoA (MazF antagonist)